MAGRLFAQAPGCVRKTTPVVWTNVELEWEEHHYIEARYWAASGELKITVNGDPLLEKNLHENQQA